MQHMRIQDAAAVQTPTERALEARHAYYRRCQTVRGNGQQCKAPAEKGAQICYAHARQQAMQERRERERLAVLEEAAQRMAMRRREGWAARDFSVAEIFTNFNAIQVTLGVVMRAIIDGRIDNKTAGRLLWELQIAAKLLRLQERTAMVATRRNRCGLEELALQNVGEPARAAEQILQPHAKDLEDRRCHASSASGWRLDVKAVMPKQNLIVIERAA